MAEKVREVMASEPVALRPDASIQEAARHMRDEGIGDVLVVEDDRLKGLVTDRDIVVRAVADGKDPSRVRLGDVCSKELVSVGPDEDIERAIQLMRERSIRRITVVEDGRAIGVVSIGDMAIERDERSALADISAAPPNN